MTRSNAERQRAYRTRLRESIEGLRQKTEAAGPFADCTPEEVEHLRKALADYRDACERERNRAKNAKAFKDLGEAARTGENDESLTPEQREFWRAYNARGRERYKAMDEARERTRPTAGTWWINGWKGPEPVEITVGPRGGPAVTYGGHSKPSKPVFDGSMMRWKIHGRSLYATKEEAGADGSGWANVLTRPPRPYADKSVAELRQIRSKNHPDKNHPDADPALYQQAVEELDRRR